MFPLCARIPTPCPGELMPAKPVEHYWIIGYIEYHTKPCSNTSKNNLLNKTQLLEQSNSCAHRNVHNRPQADGRSLQLGFATNQERVQQREARLDLRASSAAQPSIRKNQLQNRPLHPKSRSPSGPPSRMQGGVLASTAWSFS